MVPFLFSEFTDLVGEFKRIMEILEFVGSLEMVFVNDVPDVIIEFLEILSIFDLGEWFVL